MSSRNVATRPGRPDWRSSWDRLVDLGVRLEARLGGRGVGTVGLLLLGWHTWQTIVDVLPLQLAWRGWSPLHWVYVTLDPAKAALDWPAGVRHYGKSAWMLLYPLMHRLGVEIEDLLPVMIGVDILWWVVGMVVLFRVLLPEQGWMPILVATLLASFGPGLDLNLARFGLPNYNGLYYAAATALRAIGIALWLVGRERTAAVALALCFTVHPTLGVMGVLALGGVVVADLVAVRWSWRSLPWRRWLVAAGLFLVGAGAWWWLRIRGTHLDPGRGIPAELWYATTRMFSVHWYPFEIGTFTADHAQRFLPFLSLWALAAAGLSGVEPRLRRRVVGIWAAAAVLVAIGVVATALPRPPIPLVKLALHRASDLITLTALPLAVGGVWRRSGERPWFGAVGALLVLSPWFSLQERGWPLFWVVVWILAGAVADRGVRARTAMRRWGPIALAGGLVLVALAYALWGPDPWPWRATSYTAWGFFARHIGGAAVLGFLAFLGAFALMPGAWRRVGVLALAFILAWSWAGRRYGVRPEERERMAAYREVQSWAAEHTPETALFMPPPTIFYGWRDLSHRPSFGNLREWLHTSWLYDSDPDIFKAGMQRFREFGVPLRPFLRMNNERLRAFWRLVEEIRLRYGAANDRWRQYLARKYGIDYFVLPAAGIAARRTGMPVVYRNDYFVVVASQ